jgi:putative DNA primase/helicase
MTRAVHSIPIEEMERRQTRLLHAENIGDFLAREIRAREMLLAPIIPQQGLVMIYSWRGIGKTHVALNIAYSVASGGSFLKWHAPMPRRILYIDGEMPARAMQERIAAIVESNEKKPPDPDYFRLITPDLQETGIPSLTTKDGQDAIEPWLDGVELVIVDNIATLARAPRDNETDAWTPMQAWSLDLRRRGISVLFVHHAGKGGTQRGTSSREDVLDTSISLTRPTDYHATEGARFEVHFEKTRGICGEDVAPFEARLEEIAGKSAWTIRNLEDANKARLAEMVADGMSVREIAEELGMPKSTVHRMKKRLEEEAAT